jgi:hypothetical protein
MQEPTNQAEITEFPLENVETDSTLAERVVGIPNNITKTFGLYWQFCFPNGNGKGNATTIQFPTCGAEADQNYWSKAPKYSYVDYAAEQGYMIFPGNCRMPTSLDFFSDYIHNIAIAYI